jgi:hypothetical protein
MFNILQKIAGEELALAQKIPLEVERARLHVFFGVFFWAILARY